ncbi:LPD7 domain-containing protein [Burkholderia territorii]|uniref:LPD7 domain-containing protein n=1 Tax=Burkholderia territorii TaxID=1503055 RepID=UPI00075994F7|nr:LPD7 domain-containing protein [Burkholderia territorii]KVQ67762.1 DNA primase [Burkholderia territorii]
MVQTTFADEAGPVINVIAPDEPASSGEPAASAKRRDRSEARAMESVAARRRREFDAARARLRGPAIREDAATQQTDTGAPDGAATGQHRGHAPLDRPLEQPLGQPPERVRKRYFRAGNQYFLKDAPYQLAFVDLGPALVTEHNRPDVVESMIDIAHAKLWRRIRVSGHEAFRGEAWLRGTLLGIEVSGYVPKAADLARLADARLARLDNRIEVTAQPVSTTATGAPERTEDRVVASTASHAEASIAVNRTSSSAPAHVTASESPMPEANRNAANDEPDGPRRYTGELREHGGAPYQHTPARSDSYYVMFRDETGTDQVVWGVDLERAVRDAHAQVGQQVILENLGKRAVTVRAPILNDAGQVIGEDENDVHRNSWQVQVVPRARDLAVARQSDDPSGDEVGSTDTYVLPVEQTETGRQHDTRDAQSQRVLHLAVLNAAMREQGFSERSVARVHHCAQRMLDAFEREDIAVPMPKVFDPSAPSRRDRRAHSASERPPARENERTPGGPSRSSPPSPSR